jgi:hypothetical protein
MKCPACGRDLRNGARFEGGMMRTVLLCALLMAAVATAGCINKGPYYIYGDYIEEHGEGEYEDADEYPPEETAPEEEHDRDHDAAKPKPGEAGAKKMM